MSIILILTQIHPKYVIFNVLIFLFIEFKDGLDLTKCDTQKNTVSVSAGKKRKNGRRDDNFGPMTSDDDDEEMMDNNSTAISYKVCEFLIFLFTGSRMD